MNISILVASLKYLDSNFAIINTLSAWIYQELKLINYTDAKVLRSIQKQDFEVLEDIMTLNEDKSILDFFISNRTCFEYNGDINKLLDILIKHNVDLKMYNYSIIPIAILHDRSDLIKIIINHFDNYTNNSVILACCYGSESIVDYLLDELKIDITAISEACNHFKPDISRAKLIKKIRHYALQTDALNLYM